MTPRDRRRYPPPRLRHHPTVASESGGGWNAFFDQVAAEITVEQSEYVEELRVRQELTSRGVAAGFYDRYPDVLYEREMRDNQGAGMALCEAASAKLGRTID